MGTVGLLPGWSLNQYFSTLLDFIDWALIHGVKLLVSASILFFLFILLRFKERLATAAGVEHLTFLRLGRLNPFHRPLYSAVEVFLWKVQDLPSGPLVLKPNDVFVELHLGANEPVRSRVHHNAGSGCVLKESFQLNVDENDLQERFTLLVMDQELLTSTTLCKLQLSARDLLAMADGGQGGPGANAGFTYTPTHFQELNMSPRGKLWIRVNTLGEAGQEQGADAALLEGLCP